MVNILSKKLALYCLLLLTICICHTCLSQEEETETVTFFNTPEPLRLKLQYSNKQVKKDTDKKNGIETDLIYSFKDSEVTIPIVLRARGNFRRANCYFPPLKMYLKKDNTKKTLFKGHKQLKVVLPCLLQNRSNDDILKEYLAYKIYELVSEVHFKTRLAAIEYVDTRGEKSEIHPLAFFIPESELNNIYDQENEEAFAFRKPKKHQLTAILIEDDKKVAKRHNAKVMKRFVHPLNQAADASITNALFQFMIGNTDFSTAYQHNQKLIFVGGQTVPLPYDFDMSGLVDASYAVVSNVQNDPLDITDVKNRKYRGFKREVAALQKIRKIYLGKKTAIFSLIDSYKIQFKNENNFQKARDYISSFYHIIEDDRKFAIHVIDEARTK